MIREKGFFSPQELLSSFFCLDELCDKCSLTAFKHIKELRKVSIFVVLLFKGQSCESCDLI
jgi:hypothetical protein